MRSLNISQTYAKHPHAPLGISIHDDNIPSSNPRSTTTTTYTTQCNPLWVTGPLLAINGWFLFQHSGPTGPAPSPQAHLPAGPALSFTHSSPTSRAPPPTALSTSPFCRPPATRRASFTLSRPALPHSDDTCPSLPRIATRYLSRQTKAPSPAPTGLPYLLRAGNITLHSQHTVHPSYQGLCQDPQRTATLHISRQRKAPNSWPAFSSCGLASSSCNQQHPELPFQQGLCSGILGHLYQPAAAPLARAGGRAQL